MIRTANLRKTYGEITALDDFNLVVAEGDTLGLVGPNGAGKTTLLKILATLSKPDSGGVTINGWDVTENVRALRRVIGYMPDTFYGHDRMMVWEYLDYFAAAYGMKGRARGRVVEEVLALTDLQTKSDDLVQGLSRGVKQRLCLAKTLLSDPKVLLLDEPASGLDPRAREEVIELLKELGKMGKTIIIASHLLPDLSEVCNKIAIVEEGKLVICDEIDNLSRRVRGQTVLSLRVKAGSDKARRLLAEFPAVLRIEGADDLLTIYVDPAAETPDYNFILKKLIDEGIPIAEFGEASLGLRDIFLELTKGVIS